MAASRVERFSHEGIPQRYLKSLRGGAASRSVDGKIINALFTQASCWLPLWLGSFKATLLRRLFLHTDMKLKSFCGECPEPFKLKPRELFSVLTSDRKSTLPLDDRGPSWDPKKSMLHRRTAAQPQSRVTGPGWFNIFSKGCWDPRMSWLSLNGTLFVNWKLVFW